MTTPEDILAFWFPAGLDADEETHCRQFEWWFGEAPTGRSWISINLCSGLPVRASWTIGLTCRAPNIDGVTKAAAEDLCQLFHRNQGLACVVLRTSRFFPEEDDNQVTHETYADDNARANEFLFRRVDEGFHWFGCSLETAALIWPEVTFLPTDCRCR